jgi:hypothetical protein
MSKKGGVNIELVGMEELQKALRNLPGEMEPSLIRNVARKPGSRIISTARKLFTRKDTGASKRSLAILPVKDKSQRFIELGVKGRSLAFIWMFWKGKPREKKSGASTGEITPLGNVVEEAASQVGSSVVKELEVNLNSLMKRILRKYKIR